MYKGDYERFVNKPVERKPAPTPVVQRGLVRPAPPPPEPPPIIKKQKFMHRWQTLAELALEHPDWSLEALGASVGILDHSSVRYALRKMGVYDTHARANARTEARRKFKEQNEAQSRTKRAQKVQQRTDQLVGGSKHRTRQLRIENERKRRNKLQKAKTQFIHRSLQSGLSNDEILQSITRSLARRPKPWTEDEIEFVRSKRATASVRSIAEELGRSAWSVKALVDRQKLFRPRPERYSPKLNAKDIDDLRARRAAGEVLSRLAARFSVSQTTILYHTQDIKVPKRRGVGVKINHQKAKELASQGYSSSSIAERFGVAAATARKAIASDFGGGGHEPA